MAFFHAWKLKKKKSFGAETKKRVMIFFVTYIIKIKYRGSIIEELEIYRFQLWRLTFSDLCLIQPLWPSFIFFSKYVSQISDIKVIDRFLTTKLLIQM